MSTHNIRQESIFFDAILWNCESPNQLVRVQIEDNYCGWLVLIRRTQYIGQSGVHDPQAITFVDAYAEGGNNP